RLDHLFVAALAGPDPGLAADQRQRLAAVAVHLRVHLVGDRAGRAAGGLVAHVVAAGRAGVDRRVDVHEAHAGLDAGVAQVGDHSRHLLGDSLPALDAVLALLRLAELDQAAMAPPARHRAGLVRVERATGLVGDRSRQVHRVDAEFGRARADRLG